MTAMTAMTCRSRGTPVHDESHRAPGHPDSAYRAYCGAPAGDPQGFEERPRRLTQWCMRQDELDRAAARAICAPGRSGAITRTTVV